MFPVCMKIMKHSIIVAPREYIGGTDTEDFRLGGVKYGYHIYHSVYCILEFCFYPFREFYMCLFHHLYYLKEGSSCITCHKTVCDDIGSNIISFPESMLNIFFCFFEVSSLDRTVENMYETIFVLLHKK